MELFSKMKPDQRPQETADGRAAQSQRRTRTKMGMAVGTAV